MSTGPIRDGSTVFQCLFRVGRKKTRQDCGEGQGSDEGGVDRSHAGLQERRDVEDVVHPDFETNEISIPSQTSPDEMLTVFRGRSFRRQGSVEATVQTATVPPPASIDERGEIERVSTRRNVPPDRSDVSQM